MNRFPFLQTATSGRRTSHPGCGLVATSMLSTAEQSKPARAMISASSSSRKPGGGTVCAFAIAGKSTSAMTSTACEHRRNILATAARARAAKVEIGFASERALLL